MNNKKSRIVKKKLSASFGNINSLRIASFEDLCLVDEIGGKIAESIVDFFSQDYNNKQRSNYDNF